MCELFGVCAREEMRTNELLEAFFQHSRIHKDGWGIALFRGRGAFIEKEPVRATDSAYLKRRLSCAIDAANMFAHIRYATIGRMDYCNCHPFIMTDGGGRTWTMIHNGTFFDGSKLAKYVDRQEGTTDSERLLMYILEKIDEARSEAGGDLGRGERFRVIDGVMTELSFDNKINMLLYDGEYMYVHTNCKRSLHWHRADGRIVVATRPVVTDGWEQLPMNRLLVLKDGDVVFEGTDHGNEFRDEDHDYIALMSAYSEL